MQELFNLWHAQLRNVVEQIFGVLKRHFQILALAPEFPMVTQAQIPAALAMLHNFIIKNDPLEEDLEEDPQPGTRPGDPEEGELAVSYPNQAERIQVNARRDEIANQMWVDYQQELRARESRNQNIIS